MEDDPLDSILRVWMAPEPRAEVDARILDAWRPSVWRRVWMARVSVPAPVLAAAALAVAALLLWQPRAPAPAHHSPVPVAASGFLPLANGAVHVVPLKEVQQ